MKHGQGKWRSSKSQIQNCNSYEGAYSDDKKNGYGVYKWASGNVYHGNYVDDERSGEGTMVWTDGS